LFVSFFLYLCQIFISILIAYYMAYMGTPMYTYFFQDYDLETKDRTYYFMIDMGAYQHII